MAFPGCYALLILLAACGPAQGEDPLLREAASLHGEATAIEREIRPVLDRLRQAGEAIRAKSGAAPGEEAFLHKLDALEATYRFWEEHHVEVPGYEHDHEESGHHHHGHGPGPGLRAEDMLLLQRECLDSMRLLKERVSEAIRMVERWNE